MTKLKHHRTKPLPLKVILRKTMTYVTIHESHSFHHSINHDSKYKLTKINSLRLCISLRLPYSYLNDNLITHVWNMVGEGRCVSSEATASSAVGSHRCRCKNPSGSLRSPDGCCLHRCSPPASSSVAPTKFMS